MKGWVYIATNSSLSGLCKIGYTSKDPVLRLEELQSTGVPTPFHLRYSCLVENAGDLEKGMHDVLSHRRLSADREFFAVTPTEAVTALMSLVDRDGIHLLYVDDRSGGKETSISGSISLAIGDGFEAQDLSQRRESVETRGVSPKAKWIFFTSTGTLVNLSTGDRYLRGSWVFENAARGQGFALSCGSISFVPIWDVNYR